MRSIARSIATPPPATAVAVRNKCRKRSGAPGSGGSRTSSAIPAGAGRSSITGKAGGAALALALLAACSGPDAESPGVDPADYKAFFLWAGVNPPERLAEAETVYLLWGEVGRGDPSHVEVLRPQLPHTSGPEIWLAVRAERLDWGEGAYD